MTNYEKLKQAVEDGKFKKHILAAKISRTLMPIKDDEISRTKHELEATLETDMVGEEVGKLIVNSSLEALAEKLVKDDVFGMNKNKNGLIDLFEDIINS